MVPVTGTEAAAHLTAVQSALHKQLLDKHRQTQSQQQPTQQPAAVMMMPAPPPPSASQLPNPVTMATRPSGASFIPTSVIRNMASGQRTATADGDKLSTRDGTYCSLASVFREYCKSISIEKGNTVHLLLSQRCWNASTAWWMMR